MFESRSTSRSSGVSHDQNAMLGSVLGVCQQHGYESGYRRGVMEVGITLLELTEDLIGRRGLGGSEAADLRRTVLALQDDLQQSAARWGGVGLAESETVEGGLGI